MVDERDAKQDASLHKLQRKLAIGLAGSTVAAGMVVHDESACLALTQQRSEDISGADMNAIDLAQRSDVPRANPIARIEAKYVHHLLFSLRKLGAQERCYIGRAAHLVSIERLGDQRSAAKLQCGLQLTGASRPHADLALQISQADATKPWWATHDIQQITGDGQHTARPKDQG